MHRVFITGAAGYIGGMLCDQFAQRPDVEAVIALDTAPMPALLRGNDKIIWVAADTADSSWRNMVAAERPDVVVHAAWRIRDAYGRNAPDGNVAGADNVFDFAFATPSVRRLLHFSTVSAYGAQAGNTIEQRFTETDPLRASGFRYADDKRQAEQHLQTRFAKARAEGSAVEVAVLRPAAVTGPRGRHQRVLFGLQSALSGQLKRTVAERMVALLMSFIPVTPRWCRQFVHEDDVADIAALLAFADLPERYATFNIGPPGAVMRAADMAQAFGKRPLRIHPQLIRLAFFLAWHGTRGRIPTSRGTWKSYSYPIVVDGAKPTNVYGYRYRMDSTDAFTKNSGRYAQPIASFVPRTP